MSVLTLALAKSHLNIPATTVTQDTELQTVIDAAEAGLAKRVGPLTATSTSQRVQGGGDQLILDTLPIVSLTSVTPAGGSALTVGELMAAPGGVVEYTAGGTFGERWYDVVYSAGRSTCPDDLLFAVKELVRHLWETQRGGTRRPGSGGSDATANTLIGAAYLYTFKISEQIAPHIQPGFA
jgi:hypothetical protein